MMCSWAAHGRVQRHASQGGADGGAAQPLQGHQVGHIKGSVPRELLFNKILDREELTEEQLNLCRDIRYTSS